MSDAAAKDRAKRDTGKRVRALREHQGFTVAELAERAGVPRQYIYDLEGGVRVSITNVLAAARALDAPTDYLLGLSSERACSRCGAATGVQIVLWEFACGRTRSWCVSCAQAVLQA